MVVRGTLARNPGVLLCICHDRFKLLLFPYVDCNGRISAAFANLSVVGPSMRRSLFSVLIRSGTQGCSDVIPPLAEGVRVDLHFDLWLMLWLVFCSNPIGLAVS